MKKIKNISNGTVGLRKNGHVIRFSKDEVIEFNEPKIK